MVQPDIRMKLSSVHMHHIMEEFGLQVLNLVMLNKLKFLNKAMPNQFLVQWTFDKAEWGR